MDEFSEEERKLLAPFVTNTDKSVFVLTGLPEVVKGALFSRYSRSSKSLRRVLLDEFMLSQELGIKEMLGDVQRPQQGFIATKKAEEFYDRVLVGYGDDSVAELAGAHIALEDISIIATKIVEDSRIGLSPLEKSTRYVYFDNKAPDGRWRYHREKTLVASEFAALYEETCDRCFQTYADLIPKVSKFVMEREPRDEKTTSERAYAATVRAKTCDLLRGLLPASTLTNMGFFGNGRAFEYLLTKMYGDDLAEMRDLAVSMQGELSKAIPSFVKRANDKYGLSTQAYWKKIESDMGSIASRQAATGVGAKGLRIGPVDESVRLVWYEDPAVLERKLVMAALYPYLQKPMDEIATIVDRMDAAERAAIIRAYVNSRENRRHKPGRAFELAAYTFDICANFGAYRDLHRHRVLTQQRQLLTPYLGYKLPPELVEAGYESEFRDTLDAARNAYDQIAARFRKEAQYVVPLAYNIRWTMTFSLREAYHLLELRSAMQGHVDYRHVAQQMWREINLVHPSFASGMVFMDMKEYGLERLEAEKRMDRKIEEISKKYGR